ncbi:unnamed protein product [Ectocarpus sp. 12 AP-2014]
MAVLRFVGRRVIYIFYGMLHFSGAFSNVFVGHKSIRNTAYVMVGHGGPIQSASSHPCCQSMVLYARDARFCGRRTVIDVSEPSLTTHFVYFLEYEHTIRCYTNFATRAGWCGRLKTSWPRGTCAVWSSRQTAG